MNKLFISGRVVREPKLYPEVVGKDAMVSFTIAYNPLNKDRDTIFIDCTKYGKDANKLEKTLYKGVKVLVEGALDLENDDYGNPKVKVNAKSIEVMEHTQAYLEKYGKSKNNKQSDIVDDSDADGFMRVDPNDIDLPFE